MLNNDVRYISENLIKVIESVTDILKSDNKKLYDSDLLNLTWAINKAGNFAVAAADTLNDSELSEKLKKALKSMINAGYGKQ